MVLAWPAAAPAADALPVGNADGVVLKPSRQGIVVSFRKDAARRFRAIAGRPVRVTCTRLPAPRLGIEITGSLSENLRAPRRRRPFRVQTIPGTRADYCEVVRRRFKRRGRGTTESVPALQVASVPLTQRGAVHLDELERALELANLLTVVGVLADERGQRGYPSSAEIESRSEGEVVALATPQDSPPPGRIGYYSDGALHVAAVALSAQGRRLFLERDGDRVSTNLIRYLND